MRILILGGDGMIGHHVFKSWQQRHEIRCTLRQDLPAYDDFKLFSAANAYAGIDVRSLARLTEVLADFRPEAVVNCVGIIKQRSTARESIPSLEINALLPHRLAVLCKGIGARLVQLSTDCVFSGKKGSYKEEDVSDAEDLYGRTKYLGEVQYDNCLTLRTSVIGKELSHKVGLLEWFLGQTGPIKGFKHAIYSGLTIIEISRVIEMLLTHHPTVNGLYQVSSNPINKYDLLRLFRDKLEHAIEIKPDETYRCDRSLDSTRFREEFNYQPPTWEAMMEEMRSWH